MVQFLLTNWVDVLAIVGTLGTLVGIVLTFVFYFKSIRKPSPLFGVHPFRVRIVDQAASPFSGIEVRVRDKPLEAKTVTAAIVYFWNSGRGPIRRGDVLRPFVVSVEGGAEILEHFVQRQSRDVCRIAWTPRSTTEISVEFDILEFGDGAVVQVLFAGDPNAKILVTGACVDAERVQEATLGAILDGQLPINALMVTAIGLFVFAGGFYSLYEAFRLEPGYSFIQGGRVTVQILPVLGSLPFVGFGGWLLLHGFRAMRAYMSAARRSLYRLAPQFGTPQPVASKRTGKLEPPGEGVR